VELYFCFRIRLHDVARENLAFTHGYESIKCSSRIVNQIEKNEMCGACSTYGGKKRCIQDFGGDT
jgi:hypothetical protein